MRPIRNGAYWFGFGWGWFVGGLAFAGDDITQEQLDFFENRIRPVLIEHCFECHSDGAKTPKGGLRLDSRAGVLQGGDRGPALVPGQAELSILIEAVRYESLKMPPQGKLPVAIISDLVKWIEMGAPDPRVRETIPVASSTDVGKDHWAFQAITDPPRPSVGDNSWPLADSDYFILNRLEQKGLYPADDADRYTWLRRVSLDLTGLPPTVEDIHGFVADKSLRAHEKVVDRLLASPAFGERWARHWLDLVGYADQIGTSNNVFARYAWRYRDYVIDSLNRDVPFDRFVREQIAGDLLTYDIPDQQASSIIATGFLVLGDLEIVEADKEKMRVDVIDQQVVKTSKAFLGMTIGCARCHDHKFDPITQRDYYAMAGFFYNTESVYKTNRGVWSDIVEHELPQTKSQLAQQAEQVRQHATKVSAWKDERDTATTRKDELETLLKEEGKQEEIREQLTNERDTLMERIGQLDRQILHAEYFAPGLQKTYGVRDVSDPKDMRITIRGNPRALGEEVPRGFVLVVASSAGGEPTVPPKVSGRREFADWIASADNPLTARVTVNRIWQKLFGTGLVSSVDYFGVRGEVPTHPELLDHLATKFMRDSWSRKSLVRSLVLSRSYRMSSAHNDQSYACDPTNSFLWRMNRCRLDAEALRDSMLAVSGQLLVSTGGPALPLEFVENVQNIEPENVNPASFTIKRWRPEQEAQRTIYLPVIRSDLQPGPAELRNVFDFPQPAEFAGQRSTTEVPTQALFLMNSPAVKQHAVKLAEQVKCVATENDARLEFLWLCTLNRPISSVEKDSAQAFVLGDETGWNELCHALLVTNEFLMTL
jgi:hypothetical protein